MLVAEDAEHIELTGIVFDGANRWLSDNTQGAGRSQARRAMPSSTIARSSAAARTASRSNASAGRIENTEISGAADAGIYSVEASGLQITGNSVSDCANGGILVHRWQPADDGTIVSGNRVTRIAGAQWRHRPERQRHQRVPRQQRDGVEQHRQRLRLLGDPRQQRQQHPDLRRTAASRSGETGDLRRVLLRRRHHQRQHRRRRRQRHLDRQFQRRRPHGGLLGQHRAQPLAARPLPARPAGLRRRHLRRGRLRRPPATSSRTCRSTACRSAGANTCATSWRPATSSARPAPASPSRWSKARARPSSPTMSSTSVTDGAIVGYRWAEPATGDLAVDGAGGHANLTIERNRVS